MSSKDARLYLRAVRGSATIIFLVLITSLGISLEQVAKIYQALSPSLSRTYPGLLLVSGILFLGFSSSALVCIFFTKCLILRHFTVRQFFGRDRIV